MSRERFEEGDYVTKGQETGKVVRLVSKRTGRPYLTVWIMSGPRKNEREFPERGWRVDDGSYRGNERPAYDPSACSRATMHNALHAPTYAKREAPAQSSVAVAEREAHPVGCRCGMTDACTPF